MNDVSDKARRICEVAVSILDGVPARRLNTVVLNKALFYVDLLALRDYGETLTGSRYLDSRGTPINMVLAMQQLDANDDSDWLTTPFTEEEIAALRSEEAGVPFE